MEDEALANSSFLDKLIRICILPLMIPTAILGFIAGSLRIAFIAGVEASRELWK